MYEKLYLSAIFAVVFLQLFRPVYGLMTIALIFMLKTYLLFPIHTAYHLSIVVGAVLLFAVLIRGGNPDQLDIIGIVMGFLFVCISSTILNGNFTLNAWYATMYELVKTLFIVFIILCYKFRHKDFVLMLYAFLAGSFINGAYTLYERFQYTGRSLYRSEGLAAQPNETALMLYVCMPFAYFFYQQAQSKIKKLIFLAVLCSQVIGIICTVSRAGLLGMVLVGGLIFLKDIKKISTIIIIAALVYFGASYGKDLYSQRSVTKKTLSKTKSLNYSVGSRVGAAKDAVLLWLYNPVLGVGPGNYAKARTEKFELKGILAGMGVHNTLLQILAETGTFGIFLFGMIFKKGFGALKKMKQQGNTFYRGIADNAFIFLVAMMFATLFTNGFKSEIYWIFLTVPFIAKAAFLNELKSVQQEGSAAGSPA